MTPRSPAPDGVDRYLAALGRRPSPWPRVVVAVVIAALAAWCFWLGHCLGMAWLCHDADGIWTGSRCETKVIRINVTGIPEDGDPPVMIMPPAWPGGGA